MREQLGGGSIPEQSVAEFLAQWEHGERARKASLPQRVRDADARVRDLEWKLRDARAEKRRLEKELAALSKDPA